LSLVRVLSPSNLGSALRAGCRVVGKDLFLPSCIGWNGVVPWTSLQVRSKMDKSTSVVKKLTSKSDEFANPTGMEWFVLVDSTCNKFSTT
jgi:hypothetical protein